MTTRIHSELSRHAERSLFFNCKRIGLIITKISLISLAAFGAIGSFQNSLKSTQQSHELSLCERLGNNRYVSGLLPWQPSLLNQNSTQLSEDSCLNVEEILQSVRARFYLSARFNSLPKGVSISHIENFVLEALCQDEEINVSEIFKFFSQDLLNLENRSTCYYLPELLDHHMPMLVEFYRLRERSGKRAFSSIQELYNFIAPQSTSIFQWIFHRNVFDAKIIQDQLKQLISALDKGYTLKNYKYSIGIKNEIILITDQQKNTFIGSVCESYSPIFDQMEMLVKDDYHKHIAIGTYLAGGYGDAIFSAKLAQLIKKISPEIQVSIFIDNGSIEEIKAIFKKSFPELIDNIFDESKISREKGAYDLMIECPTTLGMHYKFKCNKIFIGEYGHIPHPPDGYSKYFSAGLHKDSVGVFTSKSPPRNKELLDLHDDQLSRRILGTRSQTDYFDKNSLYFGYSHYLAFQYIESVVASAEPSKDIDICLAGQNMLPKFSLINNFILENLPKISSTQIKELRNTLLPFINRSSSLEMDTKVEYLNKLLALSEKIDRLDKSSSKEELVTSFRKEIVEQSFESFFSYRQLIPADVTYRLFKLYISFRKDEWIRQNIGKIVLDHEVCFSGNPSGRTLRILLAPRLTHQDMQILFQLSHPFTIVTGDQSLSDILTEVPKIFTYEVFPHKNGFFLTLLNLAQNFGKAGEFLKYTYVNDSAALARLIREEKPLLLRDFQNLIQFIRTQYNFDLIMTPKISRSLRIAKWEDRFNQYCYYLQKFNRDEIKGFLNQLLNEFFNDL